jgi:ADP-ribosylglycohydrolase
MVDPKPDGAHFFGYVSKYRYEQGLRAGDISQMGQMFSDLLRSVADTGDFHKADFFRRLDNLFATLDGESLSGHYTDGIVIKLRKQRLNGIEWDNSNSLATDETTADGAVLAVVLAALYSDPKELAAAAESLMRPLLSNDFIRSNSIVFALTVQALINGVHIDNLGGHVKKLGFDPDIRKYSPAFDNFLTPGYGAAATKPGLNSIEPKHVSLLFGDDCQLTHLLPAAYYLSYRLSDNFEEAVLAASNSGGQNVVRAALTGALVGAMNGVHSIPQRWIQQLRGSGHYVEFARTVAELGAGAGATVPVSEPETGIKPTQAES